MITILFLFMQKLRNFRLCFYKKQYLSNG